MNLLVINDILGRLDQLQAILKQSAHEQIEAICVLGNLLAPEEAHLATATPQQKQERLQTRQLAAYADVLTLLAQADLPIYLIPGRYDPELPIITAAVLAYRAPAALQLVHRTAARLGQHDVVVGFGGQIMVQDGDPEVTVEFPEWELALAFEHLQTGNLTFQLGQRRIFLFATPPHGRHIDTGPTGHTGLTRLNTIIRTYQPDLVCCAGPATAGVIEQLDGTMVVNPGAVAAGAYAIVNLEHHVAHLHTLPQPVTTETGRFRSILVALDNSPESWHALEIAAGLAQRMQAHLLLVSAYAVIDGMLADSYHWAALEQQMKAAEALLARAQAYVPQGETTVQVLEGPAADAILRAATAHNVDLIVMGARGLGAVRSMLGSVSQRVVHHAVCPVLITRDGPQTRGLRDSQATEAATMA